MIHVMRSAHIIIIKKGFDLVSKLGFYLAADLSHFGSSLIKLISSLIFNHLKEGS